jgi:hypothetical protein|tara:strand:+ start:3098 stop:3292 length:195 start_codon:yes stop_codon:yes gene_type:complete
MQKDMFDRKIFYYDLIGDIANLGTERDRLKVGETFEHNGVTYEILEREEFNQCFVIQEVSDDDN